MIAQQTFTLSQQVMDAHFAKVQFLQIKQLAQIAPQITTLKLTLLLAQKRVHFVLELFLAKQRAQIAKQMNTSKQTL